MKRRISAGFLLAILLAVPALAIDISVHNPRDGQVIFGTAEVEL